MKARFDEGAARQLAEAARSAAEDIAAYRTPLDTTSYDDRRVGRMLARDPVVAEMVPIALGEIERLRADRDGWQRAAEAAEEEVRRLTALINIPRTDDWLEAVRLEAAHQIDRWGVEHDAGKRHEDWIALLVYLLGKATRAHYEGTHEKLLHHIVSTSAALMNWHRAATGEDNRMRPGVGPTNGAQP